MKITSIDFRPGFTVYRNGEGPVWVCPHCGPAIETPTSRDGYSDVVGSLCWLNTGGTLIISNVPRKRIYGIDFNRDVPPKSSSIGLWSEFVKDKKRGKLESYRKEYSWTAVDPGDHRKRTQIYSDFWNTVRKSGSVVVFVHRQYTRMKNFPSVMDIITYEGRGVDKKVMETIVGKTNRKYRKFFAHIERDYKNAIKLEHRRVVDRVKAIFSEFDLRKIKVEYKKNIKKDINVMKKYTRRSEQRKLERKFSEENYLSLIKSALRKRVRPRITVEHVFKGKQAMDSKNPMFTGKGIVMEVEVTNFLGYWFPRVAARMITDMLEDLVSVEMYSQLGAKQKHIIEYVKHPELV